MLEQKFYTVADVARVTGLTSRTIRNYIKAGELHGVKVGVQWRFTEADITHLFQETDGREDLSSLGGNRVSDFLERDLNVNTLNEEGEEKKDTEACVILDMPFPDIMSRTNGKNVIKEQLERHKGSIGFSYEEKEENYLRIVLTGDFEEINKLVSKIRKL